MDRKPPRPKIEKTPGGFLDNAVKVNLCLLWYPCYVWRRRVTIDLAQTLFWNSPTFLHRWLADDEQWLHFLYQLYVKR
jgi:hypothetical protein